MAFYQVEVTSQVRKEVRQLPGNVRQRILRALQALKERPRPENSRSLDLTATKLKLESGTEVRRIRIEGWRVVYLVEEATMLISVLAIRRRPPYQYEDLEELLRTF